MWFAVREWRETLKANASWWLGDGQRISFWYDVWLQQPIAEMVNPDPRLQLTAKVCDVITHQNWSIPHEFEVMYPETNQIKPNNVTL